MDMLIVLSNYLNDKATEGRKRDHQHLLFFPLTVKEEIPRWSYSWHLHISVISTSAAHQMMSVPFSSLFTTRLFIAHRVCCGQVTKVNQNHR